MKIDMEMNMLLRLFIVFFALLVVPLCYAQYDLNQNGTIDLPLTLEDGNRIQWFGQDLTTNDLFRIGLFGNRDFQFSIGHWLSADTISKAYVRKDSRGNFELFADDQSDGYHLGQSHNTSMVILGRDIDSTGILDAALINGGRTKWVWKLSTNPFSVENTKKRILFGSKTSLPFLFRARGHTDSLALLSKKGSRSKIIYRPLKGKRKRITRLRGIIPSDTQPHLIRHSNGRDLIGFTQDHKLLTFASRGRMTISTFDIPKNGSLFVADFDTDGSDDIAFVLDGKIIFADGVQKQFRYEKMILQSARSEKRYRPNEVSSHIIIPTQTAQATYTHLPTLTPLLTNTPTSTPTVTSTHTATPTATLTYTLIPTQTPLPTYTPFPTYSATATQTATPTYTSTATPIPILSSVAQIGDAGNSEHQCAVTTSGEMKCWGRNISGQVGDETTIDRLTPITVTNAGNNVVFANYAVAHTCFVSTLGELKCFGYNDSGRLGNGIDDSNSTAIPTTVSGLSSGISSVTLGAAHTCALTNIGGIKCWGRNNEGQLGDNTTTKRTTPVDVNGLTSGASQISAGAFHSCAVTSTGAAKCWGWNGYGALGDGSTTTRKTPITVSGLSSGVTKISSGYYHTCALLSTGGVKCWGSNTNGRLGDGTTNERLTPVDVNGLSTGVTDISSGGLHTCAIIADGSVKCWGYNTFGQIGNGNTIDVYSPVTVSNLSSTVVGLSTGYAHNCALLNTGGLQCWGQNKRGQLGNNRPSPAEWLPVHVLE